MKKLLLVLLISSSLTSLKSGESVKLLEYDRLISDLKLIDSTLEFRSYDKTIVFEMNIRRTIILAKLKEHPNYQGRW